MTSGQLILYRNEDGTAAVYLRAVLGTVRSTQTEIASLYGTTSQNWPVKEWAKIAPANGENNV